jgi:VIT1/CCC1 family predicted Fe2+/Mn2+ transporter
MQIPENARQQLLRAQGNEITECLIYQRIAARVREARNRDVLERIAFEEKRHYEILKNLTGRDVAPDRGKILLYATITRLLGLSFGLRLMERGEKLAEDVYAALQHDVPEMQILLADEQKHETELLDLIEEELIEYAGSVVLGLNDALMELTGALAGLTFALQNGKLIAATGFITGVAASMSMAASEFLSAREEKDQHGTKSPLKSAAYTGVAYIITVMILITPYLLLANVYLAGAVMLGLSVTIVLAYNFYITTAKNLTLWRRFAEMAGISLCVALISFGVGVLVRHFFQIEI